MDLLREVKIKCLEKNINLQTLLERYNEKYNCKLLYNSFYRKLRDGTVKHEEYTNIMDVLGYKIITVEKQDKT